MIRIPRVNQYDSATRAGRFPKGPATIGAGHQPPRIPIGCILGGIVLGFATFNFLTAWVSIDSDPIEVLEGMLVGAWVFQPMLFGIWAALGPGRFAIRIPPMIPSLMLVVGAPGIYRENFKDLERYEFVTLTLSAMGIFAATTLVLLIARRFTRWRIVRRGEVRPDAGRPLQFDTKYLITLIALCALALGVTCSLKFGPAEQNLFFGPNFVIYILAVGSAVIALLLLPILFVPFYVLTELPSKQFIDLPLFFWLAVNVGVGVFLFSTGSAESIAFQLLIQLGAILLGALAAWPLRLAGCRLVKQPPVLSIE